MDDGHLPQAQAVQQRPSNPVVPRQFCCPFRSLSACSPTTKQTARHTPYALSFNEFPLRQDSLRVDSSYLLLCRTGITVIAMFYFRDMVGIVYKSPLPFSGCYM